MCQLIVIKPIYTPRYQQYNTRWTITIRLLLFSLFTACCLTTGLVHTITVYKCPCEGTCLLTNVKYPTQYRFIIRTNTTLEHCTFISLLVYNMFRPFYSPIIRQKHKCILGKVRYAMHYRMNPKFIPTHARPGWFPMTREIYTQICFIFPFLNHCLTKSNWRVERWFWFEHNKIKNETSLSFTCLVISERKVCKHAVQLWLNLLIRGIQWPQSRQLPLVL
jgi:hypothetical protein